MSVSPILLAVALPSISPSDKISTIVKKSVDFKLPLGCFAFAATIASPAAVAIAALGDSVCTGIVGGNFDGISCYFVFGECQYLLK